MAKDFKIKWYGKEVEAKTISESKKAVLKGCYLVEGDAKRLCPVKTGRLRASITNEAEELIGRVGTNVEYARRVELGFVGTDILGRTYNQQPKPYLRPALEKNRSRIKELFRNLIK